MAPDSQHLSYASPHHGLISHSSLANAHATPTSQHISTSNHPASSRRNSTRRQQRSSMMLLSPNSDNGEWSSTVAVDDNSKHEHNHNHIHNHEEDEIAISSTTKAAGKTITPFLAKHISKTYNPMSQQQTSKTAPAEEPDPRSNTKYCNRHRPDRKCRKQADGPSMEQLQNKLNTLSHSDRSAISHVWSVFSASPPKQRELILEGLLSVACFDQLSFVSARVRDLIKIDFISLLPTEISLEILSKLDMFSLCKAAQVNRKWRQLADDDEVWHTMCAQHVGSRCRKCGWGLPLLEKQRLRDWKRQQAQQQGEDAGQRVLETEAPSQSQQQDEDDRTPIGAKRPRSADGSDYGQKRVCITPEPKCAPMKSKLWKDVYRERHIVSKNWKHGRYSMKAMRHHSNGVTCLQEGSNMLGDRILATGSYDCTAKMVDIDTGEVLRTFEGAQQGIRCLLFDHRQLMTGSLDGKVRIHDIKDGSLKKVLSGPTSGVLSLHKNAEYLAAGSMDNNIYLWNTLTKHTTVLRGHTDFVNSVYVDPASRTLFSASDDTTVALWDLDTKRIVKQFEGHVGPVQQIIPMPVEFEIDEQDLIKLGAGYDTDTDQDRGRHTGLTPPPSFVETPLFPNDLDRPNPTPKYIVTAGLDSTIRLWHVSSATCLYTFFGHVEGIWSIQCDTLRIVSTSEDSMVKVWCPHTGICTRTFTSHRGPVTCCSLSGDSLITGGEDCEVHIMNFETPESGDTGKLRP